MIINKFKIFETLTIESIESGNYLNESELLDEGIVSSVKNFFSRMLGGSVSKIDSLLKKYKDKEEEYWKEWVDARNKYSEADVLSKEGKLDNVDRAKYDEQKERIKVLQRQIESNRRDINDSIVKQVNSIVKDSSRLKDYYEMKRAQLDEEIAKRSYEELKDSSSDESIHEIFDDVIQKAVDASRKKNKMFKEKYGEEYSKFYEAPDNDNDDDLSVAGIKISDLTSKPLADLQSKLKELNPNKLDSLAKYLEKELKKVKEQKDEDVKNLKNKNVDKQVISREIDDINKKYKNQITNLQDKVDYMDQLMLASKGSNYVPKKLDVEIKSNPEIVTDKTEDELGSKETVDTAVKTVISDTEKIEKNPDIKKVELVLNDRVKKNFENAKATIEESVGKIIDSDFAHLKNDMIGLFGKLVFYYKKLNSTIASKTVEFGLIDFATEIYKYKKEKNALSKDLSDKDLETLFAKYQK